MNNDNNIRIKVLSAQEDELEVFAEQKFVVDEEVVESSDITYVPGAMGGWYEIAVAIGLTALPISVLAGCIANWIGKALEKDSSMHAKIVIRKGERSAELDLSNVDRETLLDSLSEVLDYVDPE